MRGRDCRRYVAAASLWSDSLGVGILQFVTHARFRIDLRDFGLAVASLDGSADVEFVARLHASPRAVFSGGSWRM